MKNIEKYKPQYFKPVVMNFDWINQDFPTKAPIWCSVDLRDGNQALINPMNIETKIKYFKMLVAIGFKFIEVGFPAASNTEFNFIRKLIDENLIPDDVTIQVLTQIRTHIIEKTFESIKGAKNVIFHFYNSTSKVQREQVFKKSKEEIKELAVNGAKLIKKNAENFAGNLRFEYTPESFSGTEIDYALEVCNAVIKEIKPSEKQKIIINLPSTVENAMPHVFASQINYMCSHIDSREFVEISVHPHNDRGCSIATAEMALLAGADRIEGTLFGNGERTGNLDIVVLALNMYSLGVDPNLNFNNLMDIKSKYEEYTEMKVGLRHPYAGELVFTAFSGSHQDAISKGLEYKEKLDINEWNVPYIPVDPHDLGREYDGNLIRINSQSGKGGVNFVIKQALKKEIPENLREQFSYHIKIISDTKKRELSTAEICNEYVHFITTQGKC